MKRTYHFYVEGIVGYECTARYLRQQMANAAENEVFNVRISSLGGVVADALDMSAQFQEHGSVHAFIFGTTASAATILAMGAAKIAMDKHALFLVHNCSQWVDSWGVMNADEIRATLAELEKQAEDLEKFDHVVASLYAQRSGKTMAEVRELMTKNQWLTAQEALAFGLIDEIIEETTSAAPITDASRQKYLALGMPVPTAQTAETPETTESLNTEELLAAIEKCNEKIQEINARIAAQRERLDTLDTQYADVLANQQEQATQIAELHASDGAETPTRPTASSGQETERERYERLARLQDSGKGMFS